MKINKKYYSELVDQMLDKAYKIKPSTVNGEVRYETSLTKQIYRRPARGLIYEKGDEDICNCSMLPLGSATIAHAIIGIAIEGVYDYEDQEWVTTLDCWYLFSKKQSKKLKRVMAFWRKRLA